ncbi:MAG: PIN domain-containing protein [Eubacteriales bacterium]
MRVLLDTNIVIHREATSVINTGIGILFKWLDNLHYKKCIHPVTVQEINKHKDPRTLKSLTVKLDNYNVLRTEASLSPKVKEVSGKVDKGPNDINDTKLLNELFNDRVDVLITEDRKIIYKAGLLGLSEKVYSIESFLEKVTTDNPELVDYRVLSVKKEYFGNIDLGDEFFDSLKDDYVDFEKWFNRKADEIAYICKSDEQIIAFLYLKPENEKEDYSDITPPFSKRKRLKVGTFKVTLNGLKLGERFLKIIFDNALRCQVDEIYVTIFDKTLEQQRLINLLKDYGFKQHGYKTSASGKELVYIRDFRKKVNLNCPELTYPYISTQGDIFIVPIYPNYHTNLFPDSILKTESPEDFIESEPFRNAISKVYISRSMERDLNPGDIIIFYRTGGYYKSVITTVGVVEGIVTDIKDERHFIDLCKKRSVFTDKELTEHWNYRRYSRPFIVNFLYVHSLPKRLNMKRLIELGVIPDVNSAPRGFTKISKKNFQDIIREAEVDESIIVD